MVRAGAVAWAVIAAAVRLMSVGAVNRDARLLVGVASVAFPLAAVCASIAVERHRDRAAGLVLLVSAATPTYFAWVLNVPALLMGLALLLAPSLTLRSSRPARQT